MNVLDIVTVVCAILGIFITIITIAVKQGSRISILENKVDLIENDFKIHERLNETTFLNLEKELKEINSNLYKLLGYFEAKKEEKYNNKK